MITIFLIKIITIILKEMITIFLIEIIRIFLAVCFGYQLAPAIVDIDQGGPAKVRTLSAQLFKIKSFPYFLPRIKVGSAGDLNDNASLII